MLMIAIFNRRGQQKLRPYQNKMENVLEPPTCPNIADFLHLCHTHTGKNALCAALYLVLVAIITCIRLI